MKKQEKIFCVDNLSVRLKSAKVVVLTDYRGLTVSQINQLRSLIKKADSEYMVIKNTLLKLALEKATSAGWQPELKLEGLKFEGPTAILVSTQDEIAPIKIIFDFAKTQGLPTFKFGILDGKILTREEVERIGKLPNRQELLALLAGLLSTPSIRLVNTLGANTLKLILILNARSKNQN